MEIKIDAHGKRQRRPKLKKFWHKTWHIALSFLLGVAIATAYHLLVTNQQVRKTAEAVCDNFGRDAQECKDGIDNLLDESDNEVDNNININWLDWPNNNYGTIKLVKKENKI